MNLSVHEHADLFQFLAALYLQKPESRHQEALSEASTALAACWQDEELLKRIQGLESEPLSQAVQDYYDLNFVPNKSKPPFESVYVEGCYRGRVTRNIAGAYEQWGFRPAELESDPMFKGAHPDHAGFELAFMSLLLSEKPTCPEVAAFIKDRRWLGSLGKDLDQPGRAVYTRVLGYVTRRAIVA